jgi:hypothetical protein
VPRVLAEVVGGVDQHALARNPVRDGISGCPGRLGHDVGDHVVVGHAVRTRARLGSTGVRADEAGAELGGDVDQFGVVRGPGVVDDVRADLETSARDVRPPRVDADDDVRQHLPHPLDERHGAPDLLVGVDEVARSRLHAADVDDVSAVVDSAAHRGERDVGREGGALVVERVRSAVDDRHDEGAIAHDAAAPEGQVDGHTLSMPDRPRTWRYGPSRRGGRP